MRIQLGFNEPPPLLKFVGVRELLCNNCGLEFKRFAPSAKLSRSESGEAETTVNRRRAPRFQVRLRVHLAKVSKERPGEETPFESVLEGYTRDISDIGLAIVLPVIGDTALDLVKSKTGFWAWLGLPTGPVKMLIIPVRSEKILAGPEKGRLLLGAHIRGIGEAERTSFHRYVETLRERL